MMRALRRSTLPVAYSNGFNPHILVSFASALATGAWGESEIMDVTMAEEVSAEEFVRKMNEALPPELKVSRARAIDDRHPSMTSLTESAKYRISLYDEGVREKIAKAMTGMMARDEIIATRKTKSAVGECNIRPWIYEMEMRDGEIWCTLKLTEKESCKPKMLMEAVAKEIGENDLRYLVGRVGLFGAEGRDLEDL